MVDSARNARILQPANAHIENNAVLDIKLLGEQPCPCCIRSTLASGRVDCIEGRFAPSRFEDLPKSDAPTALTRYAGLQIQSRAARCISDAYRFSIVTHGLRDGIILGWGVASEGREAQKCQFPFMTDHLLFDGLLEGKLPAESVRYQRKNGSTCILHAVLMKRWGWRGGETACWLVWGMEWEGGVRTNVWEASCLVAQVRNLRKKCGTLSCCERQNGVSFLFFTVFFLTEHDPQPPDVIFVYFLLRKGSRLARGNFCGHSRNILLSVSRVAKSKLMSTNFLATWLKYDLSVTSRRSSRYTTVLYLTAAILADWWQFLHHQWNGAHYTTK